VVSTRSGEYKADPTRYRAEAPLTGNESRTAEVSGVAVPQPLEPVDDLPPTTVVTHVSRAGGTLTVRGTTADNGTVKQVLVSGREARATAPNFAEWELVLDAVGPVELTAVAEDAAGNVEQNPMRVTVAK
jgi:hypothetical protein